jgi:hypothetical protein
VILKNPEPAAFGESIERFDAPLRTDFQFVDDCKSVGSRKTVYLFDADGNAHLSV